MTKTCKTCNKELSVSGYNRHIKKSCPKKKTPEEKKLANKLKK